MPELTPKTESTSSARPAWPAIKGLGFGGDYNPEQWPRSVWEEDMRLMKAAGVNVVSVAIFSWALLQPTEDTWDFKWLDEIIDLLHENGIAVDLATATASPPPWLTIKHPEILPVTSDGKVLNQGGRQHWRPTSPIYRKYAMGIVRKLAERYGSHPAVVAWHVNNELGCHNHFDYSSDAAAAFRVFLKKRYGKVEKLNDAWGTAFWSQHYSTFDDILPPVLATTFPNPGQQLDWRRFSSTALKEWYIAEREILHSITPDIPVTTNFMIMGDQKDRDYSDWAGELDFVSNDHYVTHPLYGRDELSFSASFTSGVSGRMPWFLMEHSTSAVNWQAINVPKRSGEIARDSLSHVAHGADAVCYFQWRQSRAGAEKYHSSMVPHAGEDSQVFRDVCKLGQNLKDLEEIKGSKKEPAHVAIVLDYESWWVSELDSHPSTLLKYHQEALDWFVALINLGVRVDVVPVLSDWSAYKAIISPILHVIDTSLQHRITKYVDNGGHLVATYFSGIVNSDDHIYLGGYPGALRDVLGIKVEEFAPMREGEKRELDDGSYGTLWSEPIQVGEGVETLRKWKEGGAAVTRRIEGKGSASYVSTRLGAEGLGKGLLGDLMSHAGVKSEMPKAMQGKVEHVTRSKEGKRWDFYINRTDESVGMEGVKGKVVVSTGEAGKGELAGRGVVVVQQE
ncbi:beta-galactosidase [Dioszegia hungarica]|uniref:beta-galactosidase n=1 Tax=Dioszegia hungarica TaxID=4972 RepID=A0AA38LUJ5_9TREE|nr:beta-galactosidase [Dioszegia hungarica]KAI9635805.1 beta-galactosidase [Dioszegia hungarica]